MRKVIVTWLVTEQHSATVDVPDSAVDASGQVDEKALRAAISEAQSCDTSESVEDRDIIEYRALPAGDDGEA
ncbi:hypothetical protein [Actinoallomurus sp. NPDC052274]|uniref:hypothetical protein n=1 Tax=Actinoallomurus sp. NPDC052274 TaxID=3155420 RepID=UPI00342F8562